MGGRESLPKNKKRLVTLASHETPEQPSPRTARAQIKSSRLGCKSHVGANGWHEMATWLFYLQQLSTVGSTPLQLPSVVTAVIWALGITIDDCRWRP